MSKLFYGYDCTPAPVIYEFGYTTRIKRVAEYLGDGRIGEWQKHAGTPFYYGQPFTSLKDATAALEAYLTK